MKKRILSITLTIFLVLTLFSTPVLAETTGDECTPETCSHVASIGNTHYDTLSDAIDAAEGSQEVKLLTDSEESITLAEGKTVTLDLNGKTLTNKDKTHTISNHGTLTIMDSSTGGAVTNGTDGCGALANYPEGTVNLKSGKLTRSDGTNWYLVKNLGSMTIEDGEVSAVLTGSSLIANGWDTDNEDKDKHLGVASTENPLASLIIENGTFSGGMNTVKNDEWGKLEIKGGSFRNTSGPVILNWNIATVDGGTFTTEHKFLLNNGSYSDDGRAQGLLSISGGTFTASSASTEAVLFSCHKDAAEGGLLAITGGTFTGELGITSSYKYETKITGGTFSVDPAEFVESGSIAVPDGANFTVKEKSDSAAEVVVSEPKVEVTIDDPQLSSEEIKQLTEAAIGTNADLGTAANAIAQKNTVTKDEGKEALSEIGITVEKEDIAIVVVPYLDIKVTAFDTMTKAITLDIEAMYHTVATTTGAVSSGSIDLEGDTTNAVKIGDQMPQKMNVTTPVVISIPVTDQLLSADTQDVFIKHMKDSGKVFYYPATLTTEDENTIVTFTNTNGFSQFTIQQDDRKGKIDFGSDIGLIDYTPANVGKVLPVPEIPSGKEFNGWIIGSKTYTTLTEDLLDALADAENQTLTATANFSNKSSGSSGGSNAASYSITIDNAKNGTVKTNVSSASNGSSVTVTATPDKGYELDILTVTDDSKNKLKLTSKSDNQYTFTMPASKVTVAATFKAAGEASALPFTDVNTSDWFYDSVLYAYNNKMMNGTSTTAFTPNDNLTRAMIVQVLYNLEKEPAASGSTFSDVKSGDWYAGAVNWAAANNIVSGFENGTFAPNDSITREQMAAVLYRYAQYKGYDVSASVVLDQFADGSMTSDWAEAAMRWAVGAQLVSGKGNNLLDPTGTATRAEVARILMQFCEKTAK